MNIRIITLFFMISLPLYAEQSEGQSIQTHLIEIGQVQPRRSTEISGSRWGIQFNKHRLPEPELMLERIDQSGVKWARVQTFDFVTSAEKGYFDWATLDRFIEGLSQRKINIFITIDEFSLGSIKNHHYPIDAERLDEWLAFVQALVERYKEYVKHWEIINEPPLIKTYAQLVIQASQLIKEIDPKATIMAGSLARIDLQGLELILREGISPHTDIITFHPYSEFPESIKYPITVSVKKPESYFPATNLLSDIRQLVDNFDPSIELWQGECGYPSAANSASWQGLGPWGETIQAKWLSRRFLTDLSLDIPVSIYFTLRVFQKVDRLNEKGLLRFETWEPKPAFNTLKHLTSIFDQDLNDPQTINYHFDILSSGSFYGLRSEYPKKLRAALFRCKSSHTRRTLWGNRQKRQSNSLLAALAYARDGESGAD